MKLLSAFAEKDPRIKVFKNPGHGIVDALQKALANSCGKFISRMDADDLMPPGRLEKMVRAISSSPPKTVVTGLVEYFSDTEISEGYRSYQQWLNAIALENSHWTHLYRECVVASPNWIMHTAELKEIGGFQGLEYPEDYDLVFRWYQNNFNIKVVPEITLNWREHPARTSRTSENYSQRKFFQLKLQRFIQSDLQTKNLVLWGTGVKARLAADILSRHQLPFHWMDLHPEKYPNEIDDHPIVHFSHLQNLENPQLLVAVYPPAGEMKKLCGYLRQLQLSPGRDYWFL